MKRKIVSLFLCAALLLGLAACQKQEAAVQKEESGGTGFGVVQKSALTQQDLYFFTVTTTKSEVLTALGSPQTYLVSDGNTFTYHLQDGSTLVLSYNDREIVETAVYTDASGEKKDLFTYLVEIGVLKSYSGNSSSSGNTGVGNNTTPVGGTSGEQNLNTEKPSDTSENTNSDKTELEVQAENATFFSSNRYSYTMAEQILTLGAERETVLSAFGKPNSLGSVTYAENSYVIDVYIMEDGSTLQLDYGYTRSILRAVRKISGSVTSDYLGTWGQEALPENFFRQTKNIALFSNLKKNTTPAAFYKKYGAPDWYEGSASDYRDAYQLNNGAVLYLNFGTNHSSLSSAMIKNNDGSVTVYPVG